MNIKIRNTQTGIQISRYRNVDFNIQYEYELFWYEGFELISLWSLLAG